MDKKSSAKPKETQKVIKKSVSFLPEDDDFINSEIKKSKYGGSRASVVRAALDLLKKANQALESKASTAENSGHTKINKARGKK